LNEKSLAEGFGEEIFFQYIWLKQMFLECLTAVGKDAGNGLISGSLSFARAIARERVSAAPDMVENLAKILQRIKVKAGKLGDLGLKC